MLDRAGNIYGTVGGILVGLAGGAGTAALQTTFDWATSLVSVSLCVGVCLIGFYLVIASIMGWKLPGRQSRIQSLIDEVDVFVEQINDWLGIRRDDSHLYSFDIPWEARNRQSDQNSHVTHTQWRMRFSIKSLHYYDELIKILENDTEGIDERSHFEHPTNVLGMESVARSLGIMSLRVRSKKKIFKPSN
ncbi:hypothetical protein [Glutamicibacter nicotianae]|uniref:hypothetical protein n=1 Tax=Glutamicibacter nicotianae TaxID=37929 RepID=UPI0025558FCC|nr:hypothetical protein [Glutamicibacter nicotianae]WIV42605.1 hypothetical protein QQS42_09695 [Glutamicibacter nicotianae]